MLSNFSLRSTTRAYPTEQLSCCFLTFQAINSLDFLIIIRLMRHLYNRLEPTKLMCRLICNCRTSELPCSYKTNAPLVQSIRTNKANVPADLQSAGIKYKDFNPLTSYFYFRYEFLIKKIAIKVWISDHRSWYFMLSDSISDRTIVLLLLDVFIVSKLKFFGFPLISSSCFK